MSWRAEILEKESGSNLLRRYLRSLREGPLVKMAITVPYSGTYILVVVRCI